jgi:hypothetical protein
MYGSQFEFEQRLECTRLSPHAYSVSRLEQLPPREKKNKWWKPLFISAFIILTSTLANAHEVELIPLKSQIFTRQQ